MATKKLVPLALVLAFALACGRTPSMPAVMDLSEEGIPSYVPSAENLASREDFRDSRLGIFIHWGVYSMLGDGECVMQEKDIDYKDYSQLPAGFCPSRFSAEEWVSAIRNSGARYITFTSRHVDGFSMFSSSMSSYNIVDATPFARDVVGELAEECRRQGLRLHLYYSLEDWGRGDCPQGKTMVNTCGKDPSEEDYPHYLDFMCGQLTELLTNYGPIGCIWFDCDWDQIRKPAAREEVVVNFDWKYDRIYSLVHELQPGCLIGNNHHRGSIAGEDIQIFERDVPGENTSGFSRTGFVARDLPLETCQTMNGSWGYNILDKNFKSTEDIIRLLVKTAGRDANLLLNVGPQPDGRFPEESLHILAGLGRWMKANGETIYGTRATMLPPQEWGVVTHKEKRLFVHVLEKPLDGKICLSLGEFPGQIRSVKEFASGKPLSFSSGNDGISLSLPDDADSSIDYIIEIDFI